jgi:predicted RNA-binding protein Jag
MENEILMKTVVDCSTGVAVVEPFTAEEIAQYEIDIAEFEEKRNAKEAEIAAKAAAKASAEAKLTALGLTPEEIAALR